jgi:hypothetical protein
MFLIFEALLLLAIDEKEGNLFHSVLDALEPGIAGAVLIELTMNNRIVLRDNRLQVVDQTPTENPLLDRALLAILETARPRKLKYWINTLVYNRIIDEVVQQLVEKDVLIRKKKRLRLVIPFSENAISQGASKYGVTHRLRQIVLGSLSPELPDKLLLAILYHASMLSLVFTRGECKAAQKQIKKLILDNQGESGLGSPWDEILAAACKIS